MNLVQVKRFVCGIKNVESAVSVMLRIFPDVVSLSADVFSGDGIFHRLANLLFPAFNVN